MFDLTTFDAELTRRHDIAVSTRSVAVIKCKAAIGLLALPVGVCGGAICLAMFAMTPLSGGSTAPQISVGTTEPEMTFNGMTLEQFARQMNMPAQDPLLIAMFEELCMT